jgi:transcriptional regulator with XRE-family HTH domain
MPIGERLRQLREEKCFSLGDIEKATGMLPSYISRVEHGRMVPSLETVERLAKALNVPLYRLFCSENVTAPTPYSRLRKTLEELSQDPGATGSDVRFLLKLEGLVGKMVESDRALFVDLARKLAARTHKL